MIEDTELLRRYVGDHSEEAFAELVQRRIGLVYAVALRRTGGNGSLAADATQEVFVALARKAPSLAGRPVLAGWLCRSAQFAASAAVRAEQLRKVREEESHTMNDPISPETPMEWERLRPMLDQVLNELRDDDRDAVVLRFFDRRPFAEIGRRLRLSENSARMRVERALEKMRLGLSRRGVVSTGAALGMALTDASGLAAPAGLAAIVTTSALAGAASGGGLAAAAALFTMNTYKVGVIAALLLVAAGGLYLQQRTNGSLRAEIAALQKRSAEDDRLRFKNRQLASGLSAAQDEVARLRDGENEKKSIAAPSGKPVIATFGPKKVSPASVLISRSTGRLDAGIVASLGLTEAETGSIEAAIERSRRRIDQLAVAHGSVVKSEDNIVVTVPHLDEADHVGSDLLNEIKGILGADRFATAESDFSELSRFLNLGERTVTVFRGPPSSNGDPAFMIRDVLASAGVSGPVSKANFTDPASFPEYYTWLVQLVPEAPSFLAQVRPSTPSVGQPQVAITPIKLKN